MKRRNFLGMSLAAIAAFVVGFPLIGCDTTTVSQFVTLIGQDAASLATYFGNATLAGLITSLAGQIAVDITNWQSGAAATDAIQAINDLIDLVGQIPAAAPYAPLIVLLLTALTGLLALLPSSATSAKAKAVAAKYSVTPHHFGGVDKHSMTAGKKWFTTQWSTLLAATPGLK